ncbi:MAG: universal stress protein [Polyangiales bacterium]
MIIVGTDLSEDGDVAIELARSWAKRLKRALTVVHAIPESTRSEMLFPQQHARDALTGLDRARAVEDHLASRLKEGEQLRIVEGSAGEQLVAVAREIGAELVVLGGREPSRERVFGSVAEHVLTHAHRPVMIARRHPKSGPIVVAVTLEQDGEPQVEVAVRIAGTMGTRVVVTHVRPNAAPVDSEMADALLRLQEKLPNDAEIQLEHGEAAISIVAVAERKEAELIVVGTHSRSGLARFVTGSVASSVVRRAPCSVLVVPLHHA